MLGPQTRSGHLGTSSSLAASSASPSSATLGSAAIANDNSSTFTPKHTIDSSVKIDAGGQPKSLNKTFVQQQGEQNAAEQLARISQATSRATTR